MIFAQESGGGAAGSLLFFAFLIFGLYFLAIRPQRQRAKALTAVQSSVRIGSRVMTSAGIYAEVVQRVDDEVVLEIAPGVRVRFALGAVVRILEDAPADPFDELPEP